jgi:hypothetical protein
MEQLYKVGQLILLVAYSAAGASPGTCSLAVGVHLPDGRRLEVPISVVEENGRVEDKWQEPGEGDVMFCDLGILPVTVIVGSSGRCHQTTIRKVRLFWEETYRLVVTYDPLACPETVRLPNCRVLFRVQDPLGNWIPGAHVSISSPVETNETTDVYGRASMVIRTATHLRGEVDAAGFVGPDRLGGVHAHESSSRSPS